MHPKGLRGLTLLLFLSALLAATAAYGQTIYGTLTGQVFDASGALVPEVKVIVKNLDTGITREIATDSTGKWIARALPLGRYSIEFTRQGFERIIRQPIQVEGTVERAIDVTLQTGGTSEVVSVVAEAPLIQTTQAQVSKGVETRRILELPGQNTLNGLALLMPGAAPNNNGRPGSGFTVNGGRSRSNNFTIDGANNNDQSLATPRQSLPPEYMGEFRIITNNFSAEFGRNAGSVVQQLTKSGTNEYHGIVRWSWLGNGYNALTTGEQRNFNTNKKSGLSDYLALRKARGVLVRNQGTASAGGPIRKDRLFFFTGYDRDWRRSTSVPTGDALSAMAISRLETNSALLAPGVVDFLKSNWPTANQPTDRGKLLVTPSSGVAFAPGTVARCAGDAIDAPPRCLELPVNIYNRGGVSYARSFWRFMQKVDARLSESDNLSGRLLIDNDNDPGVPTYIPGLEIGQLIKNINATINHTHVFSPTMLNEARATYGRRDASFPENLDTQITITGALPIIGNQNYPQFRVDNLYELTDNLSIMRGRHNLRMGANALRYDLGSFFAPSLRGVLSYPSIADLVFDRNASWSQYAGTGLTPARTYEVGAFFQDDFRMSTTLTLNLGVRYEYTSAPLGYFSEAKADINNWAPRIGFAYAPRWNDGILGWLSGNGRLSIRGGYAIAYDQVFQNILLNNSRNYPRGVTVASPPVTGGRLYLKENRPAAPTPENYRGDPKLLPVRLFSPNQRIKQPLAQQYSFGIERQILSNYAFRVFYIGSRASGLVREVETNLGFNKVAVDANPSLLQPIIQAYGMKPVTNSAGAVTAYRVDPTRGSILVGGPLAMSTYHSLQTTIEKRFSSGWWGAAQMELNYTWSSFINDSDDILGGQTNNTLPSTPFNYKLDRGRSGYDFPHRAVGNFVYELPKAYQGQPVLGRILGGWMLNGIFTAQSGVAYTLLNSNNALGILPGQISTVELSQRPLFNPAGAEKSAGAIVGGQALPKYIALATNSGMIGNLGRNTERTGGTINLDAALVKSTQLWSESTALQLRLETFNTLNRRNFDGIPARNVSNSTNATTFMNLGQVNNIGGRTLLVSARLLF